MKKVLVTWLLLSSMMLGVACGGEEAVSNQETDGQTAVPTTEASGAEPSPATDAADTAEDAVCEEYFRFCTQVQISGSVTAEFASGIGGSFPACAEWAASGDARHLDLPMVQAFEQTPQVIVALTALGEYTGPGQYEMEHTRSGALPDSFPTLSVGDQTFERGEAATAIADVAADGSGSFTATGLVNVASIQNSDPDVNAQVDLTVTWTCQDS